MAPQVSSCEERAFQPPPPPQPPLSQSLQSSWPVIHEALASACPQALGRGCIGGLRWGELGGVDSVDGSGGGGGGGGGSSPARTVEPLSRRVTVATAGRV